MSDQTQWRALDVLSAPARKVAEANAASAYSQLVVRGNGWAGAKAELQRLRPEDVVAGSIRSTDDAKATLAGLWLWHDWLDESHTISQGLATPTGSFWHAVMHRREGDFSNAKYWYARCRHHPVLAEIATIARQVLPAGAGEPLRRLTREGWDPDAFVDVVEAVHREPNDSLYTTAVRLQRLEWQALMTHCARRAAGIESVSRH